MELRPVTQDELAEFVATTMSTFHYDVGDEAVEHYASTHELDRSLAWFDGGRIVATSGAFTREVAVPGGVLRSAAVTAVGVRPTHRRRGLLTAMMRRQLEDVRAAGEPVAALWASEGAIYGRFGYGIAARHAHLTARRPLARLAARPPAGDPLQAGPAAGHLEH